MFSAVSLRSPRIPFRPCFPPPYAYPCLYFQLALTRRSECKPAPASLSSAALILFLSIPSRSQVVFVVVVARLAFGSPALQQSSVSSISRISLQRRIYNDTTRPHAYIICHCSRTRFAHIVYIPMLLFPTIATPAPPFFGLIYPLLFSLVSLIPFLWPLSIPPSPIPIAIPLLFACRCCHFSLPKDRLAFVVRSPLFLQPTPYRNR